MEATGLHKVFYYYMFGCVKQKVKDLRKQYIDGHFVRYVIAQHRWRSITLDSGNP